MNFLTTLFLGIILWFYATPTSLLEQIKSNGVLRVVTRHGPTTYYRGPQGEAGLEFDLVKRFTESLGVKLQLVVSDSFTDILHKVVNQEVDLVAAGLIINEDLQSLVRFAPSYQSVTHQLVYRQGTSPPPNDLNLLDARYPLTVITDSAQSYWLKQLKKQHPNLVWEELTELESAELLEQVWEGEIKYTLATSNEVSQMRRFYPELQVGLKWNTPQRLAWAFPMFSHDDSLYLAAIQFFNRLRRSGELAQIIERYYGHIDKTEDFDYVNVRRFHRHLVESLPKFRNLFEQVANRYQMDWRLLAAIGYEESQWNPNAVSATGVRGLMMLTKSTAQEMGVTNRNDPMQSLEGGAKYFLAIYARINPDLPEPDRTWFALAAYNVGLGHLRDAIKLTELHGDNPLRWVDVKKYLPKLSEEEWHKQTQYGYARGYEPVKFVKNVRRFYDILVRVFSNQPPDAFISPNPALPPSKLVPML